MPTVREFEVVNVDRVENDPAASVQAPSQAEKSHTVRSIKSLTGLRFLPLFAIVFHHSHSYFKCWRGFAEDISFVHAVSFFFILSGFILTYRYRWVKDTGSAFYFYTARIARLWPAHVMCLSLLILLVPEVFKVRGELWPIFFTNLFMLQSWVPIWKVYFSFNAPSWSSATLSFFDLCFPFLIWGVRKSPAMVLAVTASFVAIMIGLCNLWQLPFNDALHPSIPGMIYINPLSRLFEFAVGIVCARIFERYIDRLKLSAIFATMLEVGLLGAILYITINCKAWQSAWVPWATQAGALWLHNSGVIFLPLAALITLLATEKGLVARFFSLPFMAVLGDMSFALYMLHGVFISYFAVNFSQEPSLLSSILFFSSLLVAAHLMQNLLAKPAQKSMLRLGSSILAHKWVSPRPPSSSKPKSKETVRKQRLWQSLEAALFCALLYGALPTIHKVSGSEAAALAATASTTNVYFAPWFKCNSASARKIGDVVTVNTVWQALQPQSVDYWITAQVLDQNGNVLGQTDYCQDGKHQFVENGVLWRDTIDIPVASNSTPTTLSLRVKRAKRKWLNPSGANQAGRPSMIVPVSL